MKLKEIAERANTSVSTVSRVLNNRQPSAASDELRKIIWDIALEGGYTTTTASKSPQMEEEPDSQPVKKSVYVLITSSDTVSQDDPYFTEIIYGIREIAYKNNYILENIFHVEDFISGSAKTFLKSKKDQSLIAIGYYEPHLLQDIFSLFENIVHISLNILNTSYDQVFCNGFISTRTSIRYLHELGHTKIAFIGSRAESRLEGYTSTLKKLGLPIDESLIISGCDFTMRGGEVAMEQLLSQEKPFTAVFCMSDRVAVGAMHACENHNIRIPEDISIFGMNDIEISSFVTPKLTTIHIPMAEMGRVAMGIIIGRSQGHHTMPLEVSVPWHMVERDSCGPAKF